MTSSFSAPSRGPVLVVGGAGYIGSHTCKTLAEAGWLPVTVDNLCQGHKRAVQWGPLEIADIGDAAALRDIFARHRPVAVLHFAALSEVGASIRTPYDFYANNVGGTVSLLSEMAHAGCRTIVFSSTCATYGRPDVLPLDEDHPQRPVNPYGHSKLMVEQILRDGAAAYGLRWMALRYFNAAGADPSATIGELHTPETHLIPLVLDVALGRRSHISVFGTDYDTPDGTCIRDYIHVNDLADAHVLALEHLLNDKPSQAVNLGNGTGFSVMDVIATARAVTGHAIPVRNEARRAGDVPTLISGTDTARTLLGWTPKHPTLQDQITDAWRWHQSLTPGDG